MVHRVKAVKIPSSNLNFPRYKHVVLQFSYHEKHSAHFHMERDPFFYFFPGHLVSFPDFLSIYSRACLFSPGHMQIEHENFLRFMRGF